MSKRDRKEIPQNKPMSLRRNFSWTFIGNIVSAACQWGILVVLAKLGSPKMVGEYTLGFAITAPVMMFTNLQLRVIQATDAKNQFHFRDYLRLRLIATGLALLVIVGILLLAHYPLGKTLVVLLVGVAKAIESMSDICYGKWQQAEQMDRVAISSMLRGFSALVLVGVGLFLSGNIVWATLGLAFGWIFVLLSYDMPNTTAMLRYDSDNATPLVSRQWELAKLLRLAKLALPLGLVMLLISLSTNIPRYFIEHYLGVRELGIFAAIAYLMYAGQTLEAALGQSASPRLAKYFTAGNRKAFQDLLLKLIGIGIVMGLIGVGIAVVFGKQLLTILYTPEYVDHVDIFIWIMITMTVEFVGSFLCYGLIAARYLRIQVPMLLTVTVTSSLACFWLVPLYGLQGAAMALLISTTVRAGISVVITFGALRKLYQTSGVTE